MRPIRLIFQRLRIAKAHLIETTVNSRSCHMDARQDQNRPARLRDRDRTDDLPPARADTARTVKEKGQIAAELRREIAQLLRRPLQTQQAVEREQSECPVGATSA